MRAWRAAHLRPDLLFGIALHQVGWRITYLGAATPVDALGPTAEYVHPQLIVISASACTDLRADTGDLRRVAARWPVAFGGRGTSAALATACGGRHLDGDPVTAARTIAAGRTPAAAV